MVKTKICILDYGSGNIRSVYNVIRHLQFDVVVSNNAKEIKNSSHVILPGVGAFPSAMKKIENNIPLDCLENEILDKGKPFLGICVGMQVLADFGNEHESCKGLGWIGGSVNKLSVGSFPLPHIGWNDISIIKQSQIFNGLKDYRDFYYVHSYAFNVKDKNHVLAHTEYGSNFTSIVCKDNIYAFQFHPEKSQRAGQLLLKNFIKLYEKE